MVQIIKSLFYNSKCSHVCYFSERSSEILGSFRPDSILKNYSTPWSWSLAYSNTMILCCTNRVMYVLVFQQRPTLIFVIKPACYLVIIATPISARHCEKHETSRLLHHSTGHSAFRHNLFILFKRVKF
jgi:hypothetical protein